MPQNLKSSFEIRAFNMMKVTAVDSADDCNRARVWTSTFVVPILEPPIYRSKLYPNNLDPQTTTRIREIRQCYEAVS